jgi:carboxyl-terminal processing protease
MSRRSVVGLASMVVFAFGCSQPTSSGGAPEPVPSSTTLARSSAPDPSGGTMALRKDGAPPPPFLTGEKAFSQARATLLSKGYGRNLTEDGLYRAATMGMLRFADEHLGQWQELMTPVELAEVRGELTGEVVGIGIQLRFDEATGQGFVIAALPGSPAEKAGILHGDVIVKVDGALYKGKTFRELVEAIRGKEGETVTLTLLRDGNLVTQPVKRAVVHVEPSSSMQLPGGVGYLRIESFSARTPAAVKASLTSLLEKGTRAVVLDLRRNPGGSFDDCLATAGLFLAPETPIVRVVKKDHTDTLTAKGEPILATAPLAILVDGETSSGAEVLAAALVEARHATVVGEKTRGKGSVQSIDELGNGYAMKFTVSLLERPSGAALDGVGVTPDTPVPVDAKLTEAALPIKDPEARLAADPALRTALSLLKGR